MPTPHQIRAHLQAQVFKNLGGLLASANSGPSHVLKTTVFLTDMGDFDALNVATAAFFGDTRPVRSLVQVARLPKDVLVEVEVIAAEK